MNSLKTTIVCVVLLGVLYGMYQVINTPSPDLAEDEPAVATFDGEPMDPNAIYDLFPDDSDPSGESLAAGGAPYEPPSFPDRDPSPSLSSPLNDQSVSDPRGSGTLDVNPPGSNPAVTRPESGRSNLGPGQLAPPPGTGSDLAGGGNSAPQMDNNPPRLTQPGLSVPSAPTSGPQGLRPQGDGLRAPGTNLGNRTPGQGDSPLDPNGGDQAVTRKLADTWNEVDSLIEKSRYQEALTLLSSYHDDPMLTPSERDNLQTWLDALAAKVIYSMEHHLEIPYTVKANDTMERIAGDFRVPPTLLYNINRERIDNSGWTPGIELKVVPGPFNAEVNLRTQKLTLWLDNMYAGSFPIRVGNDQTVIPGDYMVASKSEEGRSYVPLSGTPIEGMRVGNPYGKYLVDLGKGVLIHGTPGGLTSHDGKGCIAMEERHAQDVYEILSRASEIRITR